MSSDIKILVVRGMGGKAQGK